jgi:hypothetical protein
MFWHSQALTLLHFVTYLRDPVGAKHYSGPAQLSAPSAKINPGTERISASLQRPLQIGPRPVFVSPNPNTLVLVAIGNAYQSTCFMEVAMSVVLHTHEFLPFASTSGPFPHLSQNFIFSYFCAPWTCWKIEAVHELPSCLPGRWTTRHGPARTPFPGHSIA